MQRLMCSIGTTRTYDDGDCDNDDDDNDDDDNDDDDNDDDDYS